MDRYLAMAIGIAAGTGIGAIIGVAVEQTPLGIAAGIAIGATLGYVVSATRR